MEPDKNYLFVGVFIVAAILGILGFVVWLVDSDQGDYDVYQTFVGESVNGLSVGSPVKYRGVTVGKVTIIEIAKSNPAKIRIQMDILETTPITTSTLAVIQIQGITGMAYIELKGRFAKDQPKIALKGNNKIPIIPAAPSEFRQIVDTIPDMLQKFTELADKMGTFVSDENQQRFSAILTNMAQFSTDIGKAQENGNTLVQDLHIAIHNLGQAAQTIQSISADSRQDIERIISSAAGTLERLGTLTTNADRYSKQSYREIQGLLIQVKKTSRDIQNLSRSLKENPSQIIFPAEQGGVEIK